MKAKRINELKLPIEAKTASKIYQVLKNQAKDVAKLFYFDRLNAEELSNNYRPEILKEVRDGMRLSIKVFGFDLRDSIAKDFNVSFKSEIDNTDFDNINRQLELDFATFTANESENQADYIVATTTAEIGTVVKRQTLIKQDEVAELIREQNELLSVDTPKAKKRIATIETIIRNAKKDVAKNIEINLLSNAKSRAALIGEQVVGIAEAYSRDKEANVINNANIRSSRGLVRTNKTWIAILDKRTRPDHVSADGQQIPVEQSFMVGGESLKYPRDPNGSSSQTIRCRCVAIYDKQYL